MACPSHRITTAQVRAGAPLQPALIWTATGNGTDLDTLSSNGIPVWYDEDGQEHAAPTWTWTWTWQQRSAAGARGGSVQSGYGTAYLPLDSDRNQLPIIDLLRDGRHTGRHLLRDAENHHGRGVHDADEDPGEPDGRIGEVSPIIGKAPGTPGRLHSTTASRAPLGCS